MKILTIIPARMGSKRLPKKNKLILGGQPLINWTINVAKSVSKIQHILISTDDPEIMEIGKREGCLVPWLRPAKLSGDNATSSEMALHALDWFEENVTCVDAILLLQPTSPFRKKETLISAIELFSKDPSLPVVTIAEIKNEIPNVFRLDGSVAVPYFSQTSAQNNADLGAIPYKVTGSVYVCSPGYLRQHQSFVGDRFSPLMVHAEKEILDIDTATDFDNAVSFFQNEKL